jgi:SPP1 gp7 family putative phage head morphogenesis protein
MPKFLHAPAPHKTAAKFVRSKTAVSAEVFQRLLPEVRARAITITGVESTTVIARARSRIAKLPEGANWDEVKKGVVADLIPWLEPERAKRRAELLLRIHGYQAYGAAAYEVMDRQRDVFPYWQYQSAEDSRVRPTHAALDGKVLPANSTFWQAHYPPWEFGCRCQVVPISTDDLEDIRQEDAKRVPEARKVVEGDTLKKLEQTGTLMAEVDGVPRSFDMRSPREKQGGSGFHWHPGDLRLTEKQLRARYQDNPEAWAWFENWSKSQKLGRRGTVWEWLQEQLPPEPPTGDGWPDLDKLKVVQRLGGSTGAELVEDTSGRRFVRKRGNSAEHLREEFAADQLYRAAGADVPAAKLYTDASGAPVKLAEFIEGRTLKDALAAAKPAQRQAILQSARQQLATDALLANYDVVGLDLDNMLVDAKGKIWRIDNGGSLRFRAQGARKAAFGREVLELDSLRDAKINPAAARVFGGISEAELRDQVQALVKQRSAILAAAPEDLRELLAARLADLEQRILPANTFTAEFAQQVADARILGKSHLGDRDMIEDLQVLWYHERRGGQDYTIARFKLTETGGAAVRKTHTGLNALKPMADNYWGRLLPVIKHVGYHAGDGVYKPAKTGILATLKKELTKEPAGMKAHYLEIIEELEKAIAEQRQPKMLAAYQPPAPQIKAGDSSLTLARSPWAYTAKSRRRGFAEVDEGTRLYEVRSALGGTDGRGGQVRLILPDDDEAPFALRGVVEVAMPGRGGLATIESAADAAKALGVDIAPATAARRELTYLARNLDFMHKQLTPAKRKAWAAVMAEEIDDAAKVTKLKTFINKRLKIDLADGRAFAFDGAENAFGYGWRRWDRWDLPREQIEQQLADHTLHHNLAGKLPEVIESWLEGGAQVTPTVERLRIGVPINSGMSPGTDLSTGGASYFFTRIQSKLLANRRRGITFKVGNLSRLDAVSYGGDKFGDVRPAGMNAYVKDPRTARGVSVEDFKKHAGVGSNETIFKNGFHLLEDVDTINAGSAAERSQVLSIFKKHGYTELPDGRSLEDVVRIVTK